MGARNYDPVEGRFTTQDTLFGSPTNPLTLNQYIYAGDSPLDNNDPNGQRLDACSGDCNGRNGQDKQREAQAQESAATDRYAGASSDTVDYWTSQASEYAKSAQATPPPVARAPRATTVRLGTLRPPSEERAAGGTLQLASEDEQVGEQGNANGTQSGIPAGGGGPEPGGGGPEPSPGTWGNPDTLLKHFDDHESDFPGATTPEEYAALAAEFRVQGYRSGYQMKVDSDGVVRIYDPGSNTFGSYNPDGSTKTFYKPSSPTYWQRQPGIPVNLQ